VYVKTGSIVPMEPAMGHTGEGRVDPLILTVFPPEDGHASTYKLYEDAGNTPAYKRREEAWTTIRATSSSDGTSTTVNISPAEGHYAGMLSSRAYEVRLNGTWPPEAVMVNGMPVRETQRNDLAGWRYEGDTLTTVIRTRSFSTATAVTVSVRIKPELVRQRTLLDGFAGQTLRLRETYDILNQAWPQGWTPDPLIDAMQTGDRLTDYPETALKELTLFRAELAALPKHIEAMHTQEKSSEFWAAAKANLFGQKPQPGQEDPIARYHRIVELALAHSVDLTAPQ
jgi:hypothetical protein